MDRSMSASLTLPDWIQYDAAAGTYLVIPDGGDRAVAELVISHRHGEDWYFLYEVHHRYTEDGEVTVGGDQIYSGTDWDQCLRDAAVLLGATEMRRGPVWTAGDSVWARVRRIGETKCHWANLDWQDANDWELSGWQALHKFSLQILSTHSDSEMYAYGDQYISHTDPSQPWDSSDGYDDYDPSGDSEGETVETEQQEITEYEYRLEVQTINRAESGFPRLGDRKYITFNSTVNDAVSIATKLLKEIDPANCWGAELWNQSMRYRMEYKWDISNKYVSNQQQCWLDWTGKQL